MDANKPDVTPNTDGKYACPHPTCTAREPFKNQHGFNVHWRKTHKPQQEGLPSQEAFKKKEYQRRYRLAKASIKTSPEHQATTPSGGIFSYFCPVCGSPISTILHEEKCRSCGVPQGPILMGLNLALRNVALP